MNVSTYRSVNMQDDRAASQRIADAACHLFAEQGFAATPVRQIAAVAGVTKPMVYYYYGSKEGLRDRLVDQAVSEVRQRSVEAIRVGGTCRDQLERLAGVHCDLSVDLRAVLGPRLQTVFGEAIETVLAEGERRGEVRPVDPTLVSAAFCASLATEANPTEPVVDMLWRGVAASPT